MKPTRLPRREHGFTLFIALLMIAVISFMLVTAFSMNRDNLQISQNTQASVQTLSVARAAVEEVITSTNFSNNPGTTFSGGPGCTGAGAHLTNDVKCYPLNNDGGADVKVTLNPQPCVKSARVRLNSELDLSVLADQTCALGQQQGTFGMQGVSTNNNSLCANSVWQIDAQAQDSVTNASATYSAAVNVQISADAAQSTTNACP